MDKEMTNYIIAKTNELIEAKSCCDELKETARKWLASIGTEEENEETKKYFSKLEADIMPIDNLIAFAGSEEGHKLFGSEMAKNILNHGKEIKEAGAKYCDCPACTAAFEILKKKEFLF